LVVNTGNANAGTGSRGLEDATKTCSTLAALTGVQVNAVLPFSTGVIGEYLPMDRLLGGLPAAIEALDVFGWNDAALGIMTTDTRPKGASVKVPMPFFKDSSCASEATISTADLTLTGIAKGSGMIKPNMATMLSFIATDAKIDHELLHRALSLAVDKSFNRITVDGDTSTNDSLVLVATGRGEVVIDEGNFDQFLAHLTAICGDLARACIRDGEGAEKFVSIVVDSAASDEEALATAYTVAESPLVKTAIGASDPNWGRILAAVGRAPIANLDISGVEILLNGVNIVRAGQRSADYTEQAGVDAMQAKDIEIRIELGRGGHSETVWTTDLGYGYVRINAEYRT
jgi:glutamate N-acetyltransferase/amino-acid N-acetyltransferase